MQTQKLIISPAESPAAAIAPPDDRFDRFRLIQWWDQQTTAAARVLVVGAGALGNEIVKNLALLGVGNVLMADLDNIENSNLSRSVLYRARRTTASPRPPVAARVGQRNLPGHERAGIYRECRL